jgi:hypothetical protein
MIQEAIPIVRGLGSLLWRNKLLTGALASGAYGLYNLAKGKPPSEEEIKKKAQQAAMAIPRARVSNDPIQQYLGTLFTTLSEKIRQHADKLTPSDLDTIISVVSQIAGPFLSTYASNYGLSGLLKQAQIRNYVASAKQKEMAQRMMGGITTENQAIAEQLFNPTIIYPTE